MCFFANNNNKNIIFEMPLHFQCPDSLNSTLSIKDINTGRYLDVNSTFFERCKRTLDGRQNNVVCLLG